MTIYVLSNRRTFNSHVDVNTGIFHCDCDVRRLYISSELKLFQHG